MSVWELYWLTRLGPIHDFLKLISVLSGLTIVLPLVGYIMCVIEDASKEVTDLVKKFLIVFSVVLTLSSLGQLFVPSNKDLTIILGGYWVTNSEEVKKLPENVAKTINDFLEKYQDDENKK